MAVGTGERAGTSGSRRRSRLDSESAARILQSAIDTIEEQGEAAIRVNDIAQAAGITVPSVYHWFGSREGLVMAAHRERFARNVADLMAPYRAALDNAGDASGFRRLMATNVDTVFHPSRIPFRATRLNAIGSALSRPELLTMVVDLHRRLISDGAEIFAEAQRRGYVRRDVDPLVLTAYLSCEVFSQVQIEFGESCLPRDRWAHLSRQTIMHTLFGDPVTHGGPHPIDEVRGELRPELAPTARRILDWAVERIDAEGEAALRITELADRGISLTSIYHHFGSRDGMVQAAQVERFVSGQDDQLGHLDEAVSSCRSRDDFVRVVREMCVDLFNEDRAANRRRRLSALGSLQGRPGLAAEIAHAENVRMHRAALLVEHARTQGWIAAEVDSLAMAAWLMGLGLSRSVIEVADVGIDGDAWNRLATAAVEAAFGF